MLSNLAARALILHAVLGSSTEQLGPQWLRAGQEIWMLDHEVNTGLQAAGTQLWDETDMTQQARNRHDRTGRNAAGRTAPF